MSKSIIGDFPFVKCRCGGNPKLTERTKWKKKYVQVRCNRCGRRGAVFSYQRYFSDWEIRYKLPGVNIEEMIAESEMEMRSKAIIDWNILMKNGDDSESPCRVCNGRNFPNVCENCKLNGKK